MIKHIHTSAGVRTGETPATMQQDEWSWAWAFDPADERVLVALRRWVQKMEESLGKEVSTSV